MRARRENERRRGEKSYPDIVVKVHAVHTRTHEYIHDTFALLLAPFARATRARNLLDSREKRGERNWQLTGEVVIIILAFPKTHVG